MNLEDLVLLIVLFTLQETCTSTASGILASRTHMQT
jgi:hypothetical protein